MRICAAWLLKRAATAPRHDLEAKAAGFYERAVQLDPNFALAWARLSRVDALLYFNRYDATSAARGDAAKRALENAQKLEPNSPETLLALGYYQYWVLRDYGAAKTTFESRQQNVTKQQRGANGSRPELPDARDTGIKALPTSSKPSPWTHVMCSYSWSAAVTYAALRQFPAALKLYDRVLDITPNDPDVMAAKASIYQAQGNLQEAARLLSEINEQTPD